MAINFQQVPHEFWLCFQGLIEQGCWRLLPWGCFITWNVLLDPICWEPLRGWKVIFSHNHSTWQMTLGGQSCPQNFSWMAPQRLMYCFFFSKVQISWPKFSRIMPLFLHLRRSWSKKKKGARFAILTELMVAGWKNGAGHVWSLTKKPLCSCKQDYGITLVIAL